MIKDLELDDFDFSIRLSNRLREANITTVQKLLDMRMFDFVKNGNFGIKSAKELRQKLAERGLCLADERICYNPCPVVETKSEWISVKERLPEDDQSILAYRRGSYPPIPILCWYDEKQTGFVPLHSLQDYHIEVTHWMPLPKPPED